jgi:hypothetical protein
VQLGEDINGMTGMFTYGNFNMGFPNTGEDVTAITRLIVSQTVWDSTNFTTLFGGTGSLKNFWHNLAKM